MKNKIFELEEKIRKANAEIQVLTAEKEMYERESAREEKKAIEEEFCGRYFINKNRSIIVKPIAASSSVDCYGLTISIKEIIHEYKTTDRDYPTAYYFDPIGIARYYLSETPEDSIALSLSEDFEEITREEFMKFAEIALRRIYYTIYS